MNLEDFHVSREYGFMLKDPLEVLPPPFNQWTDLCGRLSPLIETHQFRNEVKKLPLLDHHQLTQHHQLRLAHLVLCMMSSGYIWQEGDRGVTKMLPSTLAVPLHGVSQRLGIKPVISHLDCVLANCKRIDPQGPFSLENLQCLFLLPGGRACEWFFLVTAQVEMASVPGLRAVVDAVRCVLESDSSGLINDLHLISESVHAMKLAVKRMHEELPAGVFYNVMRPFLSGFGGDGSPLPKGVIYEGISEEPIKLPGGSAAQSSPIQCFDAALGIRHEEGKRAFLCQMRDHMPPAHKAFIEALEQGPSIKNFAEQSQDSDLQRAYNQTIQSLNEFRAYHITVVAKYITAMAQKNDRNKNVESLAKRGTGGQTLIPFLKSIQGTTNDAAINIDKEELR
ncbi:indoleamine 2,3-dioxygenase 2-like [Lineus longissimus]|uniref:indoleamine 2,3-dioxygenase 2-like n=1 Tax=Lineus longissimus TaxID=88925 RepID=UPI002B4ED013